jgi:1-deoxy-D-xylulose-5-phosphate reductoisomerase
MGPLVSVNSSTLFNKALELIEASLLFDLPPDRIEVVVHPQSMVHSMVQFTDGAVIAQVSVPDMRLPIALALAWPERLPGAIGPPDWSARTAWTFEPVDGETFPAVGFARAALDASPLHPAVLNAANEVAVGAFLDGRLDYPGIVETARAVLDQFAPSSLSDQALSLESVLAADAWARERAGALAGGPLTRGV